MHLIDIARIYTRILPMAYSRKCALDMMICIDFVRILSEYFAYGVFSGMTARNTT